MNTSEAASPARPRPLSLLLTLIATGLGSGYSPLAPGTAGSVVGLALYWPLQRASEPLQLSILVVVFLVGVAAASHVARRVGQEDPGLVVVDEVVGMWVSLLFLPLTAVTATFGFVLFRIMDIVKPWPARQLESLPGGWGIMADDLMAGIYANLLLRVVLLVWPVA
jgi:phosphatidylglycerophosphatase A